MALGIGAVLKLSFKYYNRVGHWNREGWAGLGRGEPLTKKDKVWKQMKFILKKQNKTNIPMS